ncbi:hypothetical protein Tsubulata_017315 [Turnera subulata]|uniref:ABC-2 type transporter transmembrane domain-containing protein n=1 Tax=Turnera subulata TaxID=218843 RepID=A0A9Q0EYX1_9ROSI|nr:hypothetical protein Tsubulata_017315 [Turnera subulata]
MELVELSPLRQELVGLPGVSGLSTEQRKRLTIAVVLVANPSIIFMDEPTSGLDARAAAIVMRTVRNTMDTGRTVSVDGVPKIKDGYNPATWMLEVTSSVQEKTLGVDFAALYKNSELCREKAAEMYSPLPYAFAQALIEIPYVLAQAMLCGVIVYASIGFQSTATKFLWYQFFMFFTLLYYTFYGYGTSFQGLLFQGQ